MTKRVRKSGEVEFVYDLKDQKNGIMVISERKGVVFQANRSFAFLSESASLETEIFTGELDMPLEKAWRPALKEIFPLLRKQDQALLFAILAMFLVPEIAKYGLLFVGEKGSCKSSNLLAVRDIFYPSSDRLGGHRGTALNLFVSVVATGEVHLEDNLTKISSDYSDALCRVINGTTDMHRALYTNSGVHKMPAQAFVGLTSTGLQGVKEDLEDRLIRIELLRIADGERIDDSVLKARFEEHAPL